MKKTMKIIDLFVKIANGEKVPKKVKVLDMSLFPEYRIITWNEKLKLYEYCDGREFDRVLDKFHLETYVEIIEDTPKKWKIKDGRFVVDKVLEDGSVIIAEEDEKIEPISVNLDYLDFDLLFPAISSKKFTHNELVIINKVNEMIKRLNKRR